MTYKTLLSISILLSLTPCVAAWTGLPSRAPFSARARSCLRALAVKEEVDTCSWQDIWSYDCAMSNVYSAAFVANDWIKSMPCAIGLADCDTPEELKMPGPMKGSGVENVDIMSFLNLKRAQPLNKSE